MASAKAKPKQTKLTVSYSVGVKVNIGNYENASVHISRGGDWDVEGMSPEEIEAFFEERYHGLNSQVSTLAEDEYKEMKGA